MEAFAANYLADLTADLTRGVLDAAGRRVREAFLGTEREQALERCLEAGIVALLASASAQEPDELDLLAAIFGAFFQDPDVGREVMVLLRGSRPDVDELRYLFEAAGYDAETLPGLELRQGLAAFEGAFLAAAAEETALQDAIQTHHLIEQTRLQREQLDALRSLVALLRAARPGSLDIREGQVSARDMEGGRAMVYRLGAPPARGVYRAALRGDGAIAQGPGAAAAGKGGVAVSGDVHGGIRTGGRNGGEA